MAISTGRKSGKRATARDMAGAMKTVLYDEVLPGPGGGFFAYSNDGRPVAVDMTPDQYEAYQRELRREKLSRAQAAAMIQQVSAGPLRTPEPPRKTRDLVSELFSDTKLNLGMLAMMERKDEFSSPMAAKLAGIAMMPESLKAFNEAMDAMWRETVLPATVDELIIGGGPHAAIYAAVRRAKGFPMPFIVEAQRIGGVFAATDSPAFYLNSRNRPGKLGIPGRGEALNILPGAPLQPADISGDEYQRNSDLAFVIRATIAMNAKAKTGVKVLRNLTERDKDGYLVVTLDGARSIKAKRVIEAVGVGEERSVPTGLSGRVLTGQQFFKRLGSDPFPFRGMGRVAVVGAGDTGKTVIEALCGQGPSTAWSVASLDYVDKIDWYGVNGDARTREGWEQCNRSRYKDIARLLPRNQASRFGASRVRALQARAQEIAEGYECVYVNGKAYDMVIVCSGYNTDYRYTDAAFVLRGSRNVARRLSPDPSTSHLVIGPAANLPVDAYEREALGAAADVPENSTALFRYAERTATLAADLEAPEPEFVNGRETEPEEDDF